MMCKYPDIADEVGLLGYTFERYVEYMTSRWPDEEDLNCKCGYAAKWADRFRCGSEYISSDIEGRCLLREMVVKNMFEADGYWLRIEGEGI